MMKSATSLSLHNQLFDAGLDAIKSETALRAGSFACLKIAVLACLSVFILTGAELNAQPSAINNGKFEPTWESLKTHKVPDWFNDAKFGIFIHWGLYSVPGWAPPIGEYGKVDKTLWHKYNPYAEWYLNTMKIKDSPTWKYHVATYGEKFDYLDFTPIFNREVKKWNPDVWAKLFQEVGARYVVLTTKHHDGFTLWPSAVINPHRQPEQQGSQRDLVGELTNAVRARGMKMGLYYSGGLDWSFNGTPIEKMGDSKERVPQSEEYAQYADAHWRELIARYQPSILWNDINYPRKGDLQHIFADYYNNVPDGVINNRFGVEYSDYTTPEYTNHSQITEKKWEECRGLGYSFGYNRAEGPEHTIAPDKLIHLLIDIVSKNGNLLLDVGPEADGTIPQIQIERLRELGGWLKMNGEAIYGTHPWTRAEGKTSDGTEIRFTQKNKSLYLILLGKPASGEIVINSLNIPAKAKAELVARPGMLKWSQSGSDLKITLPQQLPGNYAYVIKLTSNSDKAFSG